MVVLRGVASAAALLGMAGCGPGEAARNDSANAIAPAVPAPKSPPEIWGLTFELPAKGVAIDDHVCSLAAASGAERYLVREFVADLTGDDRPDMLTITDMGTAHVLVARLFDADGKQLDLEPPEAADAGVEWMSQFILPYAGRVYLLDYKGRDPVHLSRISRLERDGRLVPLCRYRIDDRMGGLRGTANTERQWRAEDRMCKAIERGEVPVVRETAYRTKRRLPDSDRRLLELEVAEVALDLRNDGRPERLVRIVGSSSAGAGCDEIRYAPKSSRDRGTVSLLETLQDRGSLHHWRAREWPVGTCSDRKVQWLRIGGRTYLEVKGFDGARPRTEEDAYHFVSTVEDGQARRACQGDYYASPEIEARWNGKAWVAAK